MARGPDHSFYAFAHLTHLSKSRINVCSYTLQISWTEAKDALTRRMPKVGRKRRWNKSSDFDK